MEKPAKVTGRFVAYFSPVHALGASCSSVPTKSGLKKSAGYFFKEASRKHSGLHERGPAALSDKNNLLLKRNAKHSSKQLKNIMNEIKESDINK